MKEFDLLIKSGTLVDPANNRQGGFDIGLANGQVVAVESQLSIERAREIYDATDKLIFPGLVDTHAHVSDTRLGPGFQMLARAGVTCILDTAGSLDGALKNMAQQGSGISVAILHWTNPGVNISGPNASKSEISEFLCHSLDAGALGIKILGGHLPLSPKTTTLAIELANRAGAYIAFHCGSTRNGSNLYGLLDAFDFTGDNRVHICHTNAYCRGLTHGSPVTESMMALKELAARRHLVSESYMASNNCCDASLDGEVPCSHVTRTCLELGGYEPNQNGLLAATRDGYLCVLKTGLREIMSLEAEEGVDYLFEVNFHAWVSFQVNPRSTSFLMATEKDEHGCFIVTSLSTDGGGIPRNVLLSHGLSLVRFGAMTLSEFVQKCSWMPARMLGLPNKGHLDLGADADLIVVDPNKHQALLTVAGGKIVMVHGMVVGSGGTIITTERGRKALQDKGVPFEVADLSGSLFYTAPAD